MGFESLSPHQMIPKPVKRKSKGEAMRMADLVYSYYRRQSLADDSGIVRCISCGKRFHWTALDAGHFHGRGTHSLRFYDKNVHAQCRTCNQLQCGKKHGTFMARWGGNMPHRKNIIAKHKRALIELYGPDILDHLQEKSLEFQKDSREWYAEIEARYRGIIRLNGGIEP